MYSMTMMCVLSDNAAKRVYYSSVFVMSEKAQSLKGVMHVSLWCVFLTVLQRECIILVSLQ